MGIKNSSYILLEQAVEDLTYYPFLDTTWLKQKEKDPHCNHPLINFLLINLL